MPRKILYDGLNLSLATGTGVATYTRGLMKAARQLGYETAVLHSTARPLPKDPMLREIMLFDNEPARPIGPLMRGRRWLYRRLGAPFGCKPNEVPLNGVVVLKSFDHLPRGERLFAAEDLFGRARHHFRRYRAPMTLRFDAPPGLLHCTYPLPLRLRHGAAIYTIHDLVPLRLPYLSDDDKRYHYRLLKCLVRNADHIVTVSETSRRDIVSVLGVDERRITNTFQAVDVPAALRDKPAAVVADELAGIFKLDWEGYLLFFGALEPKKNIMRLAEAYLAARTTMPLVVVGGPGWRSRDEQDFLQDERFGFYQREADKLFYRRSIRRFHYVPYPFLVSLIRGARAVLFPSLYEGFGLPVLEAMQLGTPVISSTEGSVPEVAGDAAVLVDPYDRDALRRAIISVACDDGLCAHLSRAGLSRAALFSPHAYGEKVRAVYDAVLK
jgi:glycosyltransferase involved in cell wall biosynthesis